MAAAGGDRPSAVSVGICRARSDIWQEFPFGAEQLEAAHARWSADWLAWERTHDADYKLKTAQIEAEISAEGGSALARARLDAVEREKLDKYQRRYEEYARVSKALRMLGGRP